MATRTVKITASQIRTFKNCRKRFFFDYVEQLKPIETSEALATGTSYHANVENLLLGKPFYREDLTGIMADAFDRFIDWREWDVTAVEHPFEVSLGYAIKLCGKIDAVCSDGTPIEHKTSGYAIDEKYRSRLFLDDQVSAYLFALGKNRCQYTVCRKPTIRLKQNETEEEYLHRVYDWYTENGQQAVQTFQVVRSPKEIEDFADEMRYLAKEIRQTKVFYRNPQACSMVSCPYASICQDYDPHCIVGFTKKERKNEELPW